MKRILIVSLIASLSVVVMNSSSNLALASENILENAICQEGAECIIGKDYGNYELAGSECKCVISGCHTTDAQDDSNVAYQCANPGTACHVPGGGKGICGLAQDMSHESYCTCIADSAPIGPVAESGTIKLHNQ